MSDRWGNIKMDFHNGQSASEAAQSRISAANAAIRAPSQTVPSDRWQPGEWGRWTGRENQFRSRAAGARKEVEKNLVGPIYNTLVQSLSGFPPEAQKAVSMSFLKLVLMWAYSFYAIGVDSRPLNNPQAVSYHFHKLGYPFRDNGEVMLFFNMFHQRRPIWEIMQEAARRDVALIDQILPIATQIADLKIKSEVLDSFFAEKLGQHREVKNEDMLKYIDEHQVKHSKDFTPEQATGLKKVLSTPQAIQQFHTLAWDPEWSNDAYNLSAERYILNKFVSEPSYRAWVFNQAWGAMQQCMSPITYCNCAIRGMYAVGRRALSMSDDQLASIGQRMQQ